MTRIDELFKRKNKNVLNVYCTAGYPFADSTLEVMRALQDSGADMIELGMPYSDPLADGPVIQASGARAIANGMTIRKLFEDIKYFRNDIHVPVILMGYMNPALQFGFDKFCAAAAAVGIDAVILPDLPMHEFETEYRSFIEKHGLQFIFLVTPETSEERIMKLDNLSTGFLYAVSSSSTTGKEKTLEDQLEYFKKLNGLKLKNPVLTGFGIKNKETFETACKYTNGAIIGTAFIKALEKASPDVVFTAGTSNSFFDTGKENNTLTIQSLTKKFIDDIIGK